MQDHIPTRAVVFFTVFINVHEYFNSKLCSPVLELILEILSKPKFKRSEMQGKKPKRPIREWYWRNLLIPNAGPRNDQSL